MLPLGWFTTETTVLPKLRTVTENWVLSGRSVSLFGTSAKDAPGARFGTERRVTQLASLNLKNVTSRVVEGLPLFCTMNGVWKPWGPPSVFVTFGRERGWFGAPAVAGGAPPPPPVRAGAPGGLRLRR